MRSDHCETCRYWNRHDGDEGSCRKRAPTFIPGTEAEEGWPHTTAREWCGDHSPDTPPTRSPARFDEATVRAAYDALTREPATMATNAGLTFYVPHGAVDGTEAAEDVLRTVGLDDIPDHALLSDHADAEAAYLDLWLALGRWMATAGHLQRLLLEHGGRLLTPDGGGSDG